MTMSSNGTPAFNVLFEDGTDRVVYCYECRLFHVYYGTVSIDLARPSLDSLASSLEAYHACYEDTSLPDHRSVEISTPCSSIRFLLSVNDLFKFSSMLRKAGVIYDERYQATNN
ncbi:MAG: hypothetical protein AAFN92_03245 [Bacteroidota bacterium]